MAGAIVLYKGSFGRNDGYLEEVVIDGPAPLLTLGKELHFCHPATVWALQRACGHAGNDWLSAALYYS